MSLSGLIAFPEVALYLRLGDSMDLKSNGTHTTTKARISSVWGGGAANPQDACAHFEQKLRFETDPSDVNADMTKGIDSFIVIDARSEAHFRQCHIPGAMNMPARSIDENSTAVLDKTKLIVTYCWGNACNGSTKAAARFAGLGFQVKEMIGGIEYWRREGFPVEGEDTANAPLVG